MVFFKHLHFALGWNVKTVKNGKTGITGHSRVPGMDFFHSRPFSAPREWPRIDSRPLPAHENGFFKFQ